MVPQSVATGGTVISTLDAESKSQERELARQQMQGRAGGQHLGPPRKAAQERTQLSRPGPPSLGLERVQDLAPGPEGTVHGQWAEAGSATSRDLAFLRQLEEIVWG